MIHFAKRNKYCLLSTDESTKNCLFDSYGVRKISWTEIVSLLKSIAEEEERNVERAVVDEGPYRIRPRFTLTLQVSFSDYILKSHAQKERIKNKVHSVTFAETFTRKSAARQVPLSSKRKEKSLTACAYINIPESVGGKPGQAERRRCRSSHSTSRWLHRQGTDSS